MNKDKAILNICPEEEFYGREKEIHRICSSATSDRPVSSIYLWGGRKSGKTEILKRVYHKLFWEQDKVVPFYYSVKTDYRDPFCFAEDYLSSFIRQYLAFLKKDPLLVMEALPLKLLEQSASDDDMVGLSRLLTIHREGVFEKNHEVVLKNALSAPYLISKHHHPQNNARIFVILDDFYLLGETPFSAGMPDALKEYPELLRCGLTPHLITGDRPAALNRLFKGGSLLDTLDIQEINDLDDEKGVSMLEGLCAVYGLKYDKDVLLLAVKLLGGKAFYLRCIAAAARKLGAGFLSLKELIDIYTYEIMKGGISCCLSSLISSMLDGYNGKAMLKLLNTCISAENGVTLNKAAEKSGVKRDDLLKLLKWKHLIGLADNDSEILTWVGEKPLADFIEISYGMEVRGFSASQVRTEIAGKRIKEGYRPHVPVGGEKKEEFAALIARFDGRNIPKTLFDNDDFMDRYGKSDARVDLTPTDDGDFLTLPQIIGCFEGKGGTETGFYIIEAHGFYDGRYEDGNESVWITGIKDLPEPVNASDIAQFESRCNSLRGKDEVVRTEKWFIGRRGFSHEALEAIEGKGIFTSDYTQVRILQRLLEDKNGQKPIHGLMPLREFELIIPMAADAELVAARALEEVAKKAGFDEETVPRIRMAVIEACINAFEHSMMKGGKVSLKIFVEADRLVIHVRNEGKAFDASRVARPDIDSKIKGRDKRGWGIEIMKGLMDEISFECIDGVTKLVMVKYLKPAQEKVLSSRIIKIAQSAS